MVSVRPLVTFADPTIRPLVHKKKKKKSCKECKKKIFCESSPSNKQTL